MPGNHQLRRPVIFTGRCRTARETLDAGGHDVTDEPTLGEAMRRLDAVTRQLDALAKSLAEDRRDFASTYVRYDVYEARHAHLDRRVGMLEADNEERDKTAAETRRQFVFLVLGIAIPAVIGLLLGIASITGTPSP